MAAMILAAIFVLLTAPPIIGDFIVCDLIY